MREGNTQAPCDSCRETVKYRANTAVVKNRGGLAKDYLDVELKDASFPDASGDYSWGGTSFSGETLQDFIEELEISEDTPLVEVNKALIECNIQPIGHNFDED